MDGTGRTKPIARQQRRPLPFVIFGGAVVCVPGGLAWPWPIGKFTGVGGDQPKQVHQRLYSPPSLSLAKTLNRELATTGVSLNPVLPRPSEEARSLSLE